MMWSLVLYAFRTAQLEEYIERMEKGRGGVCGDALAREG
jgi:hypothetical protein